MLPSHKVSAKKKQWHFNFSGIQGICELVVFLYENGLLQNRADVKSRFCDIFLFVSLRKERLASILARWTKEHEN